MPAIATTATAPPREASGTAAKSGNAASAATEAVYFLWNQRDRHGMRLRPTQQFEPEFKAVSAAFSRAASSAAQAPRKATGEEAPAM